MKALLVLALLAASVLLFVSLRQRAASTWCTAEPVRVCASIHPTTSIPRRTR